MNGPIDAALRRRQLEQFAGLLAEKRRRAAKVEHQTRGYRDQDGVWRCGLLSFVKHFWHVLEPETPFVSGWVLEAVAEHLEAVTHGEIKDLLVNVFPGAMKALDVETPILTTWGWKRHGDLKVGDFVFGPSGEPRRVDGVTDHRPETAYEVAFDDGTKIIAGAGHLWEVERDYPQEGPYGKRVRRKTVVSTPELIESVKGRALQRPDRIETCRPIQFPPRRFLIDPYLLGAWLGDGATLSGVIYTAEQDREHFERLGRVTSTTIGPNGRQDFHRIGIDGFQVRLRILGLLGNKHIPDDYLEASVEQRIALLQGLMDTDGSVEKTRGTCSFTTKLKHLADQMVMLLSSLGIKANANESWSTIKGQKFGPYWQISFTAPLGLKVFRLDRKQSRVRFAQSKRANGRYVKSVRDIGEKWVNCIQVEGSLYLAGRKFVTTHNSLLTDVFFPAWEWGPMKMAHLRYVTFSYSSTLTERDNLKFRDLVSSPEYQQMYGQEVMLRQTGATKVSNHKQGWKLASSVGGTTTGQRGNRAICDDLNSVKESESKTVIDETNRWFRESLSSRLNNIETDAKIVIAQRTAENDVSGTILELELPYTHLCIPMRYVWSADENGEPYATEIGWVDPRWRADPEECEGELAWPERFPEDAVDNLERELGPFATACQYQQTPEPRGGGIIKRDFWQPWEGKFPAFSYVFASLDGAFTSDEANDPSALTVWGVFENDAGHNRAMLIFGWHKYLEFEGQRLRPDSGENQRDFMARQMKEWGLIEWTEHTCSYWKVDRLLIEAKASGISVSQSLQKRYRNRNWSVQLMDVKGDKVARAIAVQPTFAQKMIHAPFERAWCQDVVNECAIFPHGKHDDYVDSCTQAVKHLRDLGLLEFDDDIRAEELREARLPVKDDKLKNYMPGT